jgi:hypothetical protein
MNIDDISNTLNDIIKFTMIHTVPDYGKLLMAYNDRMKFSFKGDEININDVLKLGIDGLNDEGSYVNNAFKRLDMKTIITLKLDEINTVTMIFYHNDKDLELMKKCIRRVHSMINVFGNAKYKKIYDGMIINILLYDAPRFITREYNKTPEEMTEISKKAYFNCMCGYANINKDNKFEICVTRRNGCLGLLTHELCHICELDTGSVKNGQYNFPIGKLKGWNKYVMNNFDVSDTCKIGNMTEGIDNGNSTIIHAMFTALESNPDPDNAIKSYTTAYVTELIHSLEMIGNLLRWFKYKDLNGLLKRNKLGNTRVNTRVNAHVNAQVNVQVNAQVYTQKSMLLEYILVRGVYLLHFDKLGVFKTNYEGTDDKYITEFNTALIKSKYIINYYIKHKQNTKIQQMEYYHAI